MGAWPRGDDAVQAWVKPEVDPPEVCALPRGEKPGHRPRMPQTSAALRLVEKWRRVIDEVADPPARFAAPA